MIMIFITGKNTNTLRPFLDTWPNEAAASIRLVPYEHMHRLLHVKPGVFLFSDIERLKPWSQQAAELLCGEVQKHFGAACVVNHPARVLRRYALLSRLWESGFNAFRIFSLPADAERMRFPVFIRRANDHSGSLTPLIKNRAEFEARYKALRWAGVKPAQLIAVEFCDTLGEDGFYRKYSAFRVGERIIPGHIICSKDWVTKNSPPEPLRDEERDYLLNNPHQHELMRIFRMANIDFGRIDYGLKDGKIQVWEINTNPVLIQSQDKYSADKLPMKQRLVDQLAQAFRALMQTSGPQTGEEQQSIAVHPLEPRRLRLDLRLDRKFRPLRLI
jgi:hypothetical protein